MTPSSFGPYTIIRPLGSGGMADVYLGEHTFIRSHRVAIKVPKSELLSPQLLHRFRQEARALVDLDHPAIVRIRHYDELDGHPYIVMDYMPGGSLADRLDKQERLSLKEALPIVERLAEALDHAHSQDVLHRDVKPANILFDRAGRAHLSDFGIAKVIREAGDTTHLNLTGAGGIPGTPPYVSPEQMRYDPFDHRIDVYALGVVVFEMLSGSVPYRSSSPALQASMHATAPIPSLRERQPELPENVDAFINRALAKEPDERFQTAGELAAVLRDVVYPTPPPPQPDVPEDEPVEPQPDVPEDEPVEPQPVKELKEKEKKPGSSSDDATCGCLIIIAAVILVVVLIVSGVYYFRGRGQSPEPTPLPLAVETVALAPESDDTVTPSSTHEPTSTSPTSSDATTVSGEIIHIVQAGENLYRIGLRYGFTFQELVAYNGLSQADGLEIGQAIRIPPRDHQFELNDSEEPTPASTPAQTPTASPSPTSAPSSLVAAPITMENASQIRQLASMIGHTGWVRQIAFSPNGEILASRSEDRTVRLWRVADGEPLATLTGHTGWLNHIAFSPDGEILASASSDNSVRLWRVADGELLATLTGHTDWVRQLAFSPDGEILASASSDNSVRLWRVADGELFATLTGHTALVGQIVFSPDGQLLASGSADNTIRLWRVADGSLLAILTSHTDEVTQIAFSPDGQLLASGSADKTVRLWRVADGRLLNTPIVHTAPLFQLAFSPDGQVLASRSADSVVQLWRVADGRWLATLAGHTGWVNQIVFSPNGQLLASGSYDKTVRLWSVVDGGLLATLTGHTDYVTQIAFSPNGQMLASASYDNTLGLWGIPAEGAAP